MSPFTGNRRTDQTNGISDEAGGEVQEIIYGSVVKRHHLSGMKSIMYLVFKGLMQWHDARGSFSRLGKYPPLATDTEVNSFF